jgi:HK97 family phage major capsid protein
MPNIVLERKLAERAEQIAAIESILNQVDGRDLTDAETAVLESTRIRIGELDKQIEPLEEYERVKAQHAETVASLPRPAPTGPPEGRDGGGRRADGSDRTPSYPTAGAFLVDLIRARGFMRAGDSPDPAAQARVQQSRVVANQVTGDTPGILPQPIVGGVVNLIDANRPLITSLGGAMALGNIPGTTFTRPKITQHTQVGEQTAEKTELPSRVMKIDPVPFTKRTYGGTVDISRQDIDWTSPAAWDILVRDLADSYAEQTETVIAAAFKLAAIGAAEVVDDASLAGWADALYKAAAKSYNAGKRMPDRIWCSLDVWAALGALVDVARVVFPPAQGADAGTSSLADFRGDVIGLPRIVVPTFAAGTCIVGPSSLYEVYEEVVGLLSVVEPSILGVTVAYGGYVAWGTLAGPAFVPVTPPAGLVSLDNPETASTGPASTNKAK